jgi:hypothetical protein
MTFIWGNQGQFSNIIQRIFFIGWISVACVGFSQKKIEVDTRAVSTEETVWVMRSDGAQSCSTEPGRSLAESALDLETEKIPILESIKGADGAMHIQMCGALKGSVNAYRIPKKYLSKAQKIGFQLMNRDPLNVD